MKKNLSMLLVLVLLVSAVAIAQAETLTVWYSGGVNGKAVRQAAAMYMERNPETTIDVQEVATSDRETRMTVALSSGDMSGMPDVTLFQDYSAQKFLQFFPNCFVDLSEKIDFSVFAQDKVGYWTYENGVYGLPFDSAASALFVRTDYLEAAGYTVDDVTGITWDEFIEIGKKVKEVTGKYMITETNYENLIMVLVKSAGTWYFNEDGTANIAENQGVKAALETIKKLHDSGIIMENSDWAGYIASLNSGDAASTATGNWILGSIVGAKDQSGLWAMTTIPSMGEGMGHYSSNGGSSWCILSSSEKQELAYDFINMFMDDEFNTFLVKELATVPTYLPAQALECVSAPYAFTNGQLVFKDIMDYTAKTPVITYGPYNAEVNVAMINAVQEIFSGVSIEDALANVQDTVSFLIEE